MRRRCFAIDFRTADAHNSGTGRARSFFYSLHGPEGMRLHRFQIYLLLLLQVILPSGAPWLHQVLDGQCCSAHSSCAVVDANNRNHSGHCCCAHHKHELKGAEEAGGQSSSEDSSVPHDCSNCVLCQTLAAPRIVAEIITLPQSDEWIAFVHNEPAADPMLGFGLPLKCRAPPAA